MSKDLHPGMMGDGTEEQNLGQTGDPSKRITEAEVQEAFGGQRNPEPRAFAPTTRAGSTLTAVQDKAQDMGEAASDAAGDTWSALKDRAAQVREHVEQSAESVRAWASEQTRAAKQTAADKPVLVVSISAGAALALGLAAGFVIGRASAD